MDDRNQGHLERVRKAKKAVQKQMVGYIATALGLVAGLAWNDAIKGLIEKIYPVGDDGVMPKFVYAVILTLVVALALYLIQKTVEDNESKS